MREDGWYRVKFKMKGWGVANLVNLPSGTGVFVGPQGEFLGGEFFVDEIDERRITREG